MGRKKKFEPIQIFANEPDDIFQIYRIQIAKAIIESIDYGIKYKQKRVDFAQVIIKEILAITLSIDSREFTELLDENLQTLIDFEEYETCALAVKLKNKLNKQIKI